VFAALMTKVGIYALMRTFTIVFPGEHTMIDNTLLCLGLVTMVLGVLGAMTHSDVRRILAFHVIGSIGFMLIGLGLGSALAMGAAIFYMMHGILIKALLFMIAGVTGNLRGSFGLSRLGGLYQDRPGFPMLFLLAALSLIGIPPLSGFWAKLLIIEAGLHHDATLVIIFVILVSLLTFIPLIRIWSEAFWKPCPFESTAREEKPSGDKPLGDKGDELTVIPPTMFAWVPVLGLSLIMLLIGFLPGKIIALSDMAAEGLMKPAAYLETVLPEHVNKHSFGTSVEQVAESPAELLPESAAKQSNKLNNSNEEQK